MRVLMFGWEFPPYLTGGLATATVGLVKGLLRRGVDVTLVVPFPVDASPFDQLRLVSASRRMERLVEIRIPSPVSPYAGVEEYGVHRAELVAGTRGTAVYGGNVFEEVERLAEVAGDIAREEPHDVIAAHDWITFQAGIAARQVSGRPLVAHIHATEWDRSGEYENPEIASREEQGLRAADLVISNSGVLARQVAQRYRLPDDRITAIHWGVDDEHEEWHGPGANPLPARSPVVLFLGRLTRQKGPEYFVEMARRVIEHVPDVRFVVAGAGDLLPYMVERSAELGIADRVHFAGRVGGAEVDRAFRLATVCVMTSVSEPFGLVALESLRAGTPCIIPRASGAAEALRHALKIDYWDVDELTNQVVAIVRHRALRDELSQRGLAEVQSPRFSLDAPALKTERVYRRAILQQEA